MYKKYSEGFILSEIISLSSESGINTIRIVLKSIKFTIISYLVSVLLLAGLSVIIVYTDVPEKISAPAVTGIKLFGAFLSAFLTSKSCQARGWLCGLISGVLNIFILTAVGSLFTDYAVFASANLTKLGLGGICGMVGGIIGVNFGKN